MIPPAGPGGGGGGGSGGWAPSPHSDCMCVRLWEWVLGGGLHNEDVFCSAIWRGGGGDGS